MRMHRTMSIAISIALCYYLTAAGKTHDQHRAMTFLDIIQMRSSRSPGISPDGKWFIYVLQIPDWKSNKKYSDIYLTPLSGGATRQMTFTVDKNERLPKWYRDSSFFAFISNQSEGKNQVFFMSLNGGDVRQVTDEEYGVYNYEWSSDGKYLSYLSGKPNDRQIWLMPGKGGEGKKLTDHATSISTYIWSPDSETIYYVAPKTVDRIDQQGKEKGFGVRIRDRVSQPSYLWKINVHTGDIRQLSKDLGYSVYWPKISPDGKKIFFSGSPTRRHATAHENEIFLLDLATGNTSQVTDNHIWEVYLRSSPDSKWFAFSVADDGEDLMDAWKICVVPSEGGTIKKLLRDFDYDPQQPFWSDDSKLIYFSAQVGVNRHLFSVHIDDDKIEQKTHFGSQVHFTKDNDSGKFYIRYSDPRTPGDYYYSEPKDFDDKDSWVKLTDTNPQLRQVSVGEYETVEWNSKDGRVVEGLLVKPVNYSSDKRYPLIVQLHGGPLSTSTRSFGASWWEYVHVYVYRTGLIGNFVS